MSNLHDFWGGEDEREVLAEDATVSISDDFAAPCYQCYRTDYTEFSQSRDFDCLDVRCTQCNVEYRFRLPGLWRMLGLS